MAKENQITPPDTKGWIENFSQELQRFKETIEVIDQFHPFQVKRMVFPNKSTGYRGEVVNVGRHVQTEENADKTPFIKLGGNLYRSLRSLQETGISCTNHDLLIRLVPDKSENFASVVTEEVWLKFDKAGELYKDCQFPSNPFNDPVASLPRV